MYLSKMKLIPVKKEDLIGLDQKLERIPAPNCSAEDILDTNTLALVEAIPAIIGYGETELVERLKSREFEMWGFCRSGKVVPFIALNQLAIHQMAAAQEYLFSQLSTARDYLEKFIQLYAPEGIAFQKGNHLIDFHAIISGLFSGKTIKFHGTEKSDSTTVSCGGKPIQFSVAAGVPYLEEMFMSILRCRNSYWDVASGAAILLSLGNSEREVSDFVLEKERSALIKANALNRIFTELPFTEEQLMHEEESTRRLLSFYNALCHLIDSKADLKRYTAYHNSWKECNYHYRDVVERSQPSFWVGKERWDNVLFRLCGKSVTLYQKLCEGTPTVSHTLKDAFLSYVTKKPTLVLPHKVDNQHNPQLLLAAPREEQIYLK